MKADTKPTLEDAAIALCKGATPPQWVVERLRRWAALVAHMTEYQDDELDRLLLKNALQLQELLRIYTVRVYKLMGEEVPDCIDDMDRALDELLPILAEGVELPRRGPKLNDSRHLCAAVCMNIWSEYHHRPQPHSPKLWEACEAYWLACGREGYSSVHIKNWEDYLLKNIDHPPIALK